MRASRKWTPWVSVILAAAFVLGAAVLVSAAGKETRWAYVENQTNSDIVVAYEEVTTNGNRAKTQIRVSPGETARFDTTVIQGEACAWGGKEYSPSEKIGCRTLRPGDHWVIH